MVKRDYFFCGVGGSGMMPLALIVAGQGHRVAGSDRSLDQGRTSPKFDWLRSKGIALFPQDGSGITRAEQIVVASTAVEETVPDIVAAKQVGASRLRRADLLAQLFNASAMGIAVGGTSGKSTVTGMIGWIFHALGQDPTVMNGAVMKNFATPDAPFASALVGQGAAFISEVDESDGSIALYAPDIAVLNNIALDHKSMDELRALFSAFTSRARISVLNLDNAEVASFPRDNAVTYSITGQAADLVATDIVERPDGVDFRVKDIAVSLQVPGRHNVSNALAALAASQAAGLDLAQAAQALGGFVGLKRRMDIAGTASGITVIDDFGHNPDKISATLATLHAFPGRLLLFFQPHGYGPLKQMGHELINIFAAQMRANDQLILCDPVYFGGTVDRSVGSAEIVAGISAAGRQATYIADRSACADQLVAKAQSGDRIVIMGARDDTLSAFAADIVARLGR
ncbi:MAG: UDP-N-acetylmuramate--alanine ligase [Alphaproteobacteria bacterium]|nr:UDP-N-acetylmuramate--alanine ligase [Alphaproteobacteria bacterium]